MLTNGTLIHKPEVASALKKIDDNILKLDSGIEDTIRLIDQPNSNYSLSNLLQNINTFEGNLIIQTLFVHGTYDDKTINNTTEADVNAWLKLIEQIAPKSVMIYTIERDTPKEGLKKVNLDELNRIAQKVKKLGIATQVSG